MATASAPPTSENAYCGKGNIPHFGDKDGVAELPKTCYYTALDGTPSPGKQISVSAKADLTGAVEGAKCGDTLLLQAGASYEIKELPEKKCDEGHYITIRTDTPDSKLPSEGTRISPAWAGIAALPGRPPFAQPAGGAARLMATIAATKSGGVTLGDHVRFIGIEWISQGNINRIISTEHSDHLIFDRNYIHPVEGEEIAHGISMAQGAQYIAVINSYVSGLNCIAMSRCTDATALGGGNGDGPMGTFKIFNNFLESSGENIIFGGAGATATPVDIEIRRNHLFKPLMWRKGDPAYIATPTGKPVIVKNNFELKNAQRVLFEANLLEGSWGGFTQAGFSVVLTPKNQNDKCPICRVSDVTIRYCRIRNVASVFNVSNVLSVARGPSTDGGRYSIHDVFADQIRGQEFDGGGVFMLLMVNKPPLHDVQIEHVTAFVPGSLFNIMDIGSKMENMIVRNNVLYIGDRRPPVASAGGGPANCAVGAQKSGPGDVMKECFSTFQFEKNMIMGDRASGWPAGTILPSSPEDGGIRDFKDGTAANSPLCHEKGPGCKKVSPGVGAATDGRDLGADMEGLEQALAGVE
ncbi:MAG: hypothetical protein WBS24_01545 [Terriglobales bacterium]